MSHLGKIAVGKSAKRVSYVEPYHTHVVDRSRLCLARRFATWLENQHPLGSLFRIYKKKSMKDI